MKRYIVYARRKDEKNWSVWTDTNDVTKIEGFINRIRELGYDAKVTDPAVSVYENKIEKGYLLETPVHIGQTVYAIVDEDTTPDIKTWEVKSLHYDGKKWWAIDECGLFYEVGSNSCIPIIGKAFKILERLKGDSDEQAG
jgi:hypothetical protein